ncbi:hypothetical protein HMPREF9075_00632 [Capnocytophaga sp. oral taxon 332 str. F0381]|jgi:hypothetical protein|uniref:hypothetical protein n=1 Tax=Capnocytophaga sp. oral taxon 332 TaxID=712213 RepID=UPI0002A4695D|nr:hypothetical protein [Capnocytophaga sp. oral taxon 332]EKY11538.1 hypothetical protein HMPREF9075_00632 [Capnocytophaga sp. oral taxon 332 str. F0381]
MELVLNFSAPQELNNLKEAGSLEKYTWIYGVNSSDELKLDLDTWIISSKEQEKSAHITQWKVNQQEHSMILEEDSNESYQEIDLSFAVAMLGQLVSREDLIRYLKQLKKEFAKSKEDFEKEENGEKKETEVNS